MLWLAGVGASLALSVWMQALRPEPRPDPAPAPREPPPPVEPTPAPEPEAYRARVGALNRFGRAEREWAYSLTYGFIDHHGQQHEVSCDVSRLEHEREAARFGYDTAQIDAALAARMAEVVRRELDRLGVAEVVEVATTDGGGYNYRIQGRGWEEQAQGVTQIVAWFQHEYPKRRQAIHAELLRERGLRLADNRIGIDHALVAERAARPLADCFRALARAGHGGSERRMLGLFLAFFQEIRYEVPPDEAGGRRTLGLYVPTDVLVNNRGDCDSKAVAFAAMWRNFEAPLLLISLPRHMLVGVAVRPGPGEQFVRLGNRYYVLCEVAGPGKLHPGAKGIPDRFEYVLLEPRWSTEGASGSQR